MKKQAYVVMADGSEEMETVIVVDVLRRGGIDVCVAGIGGGRILTSSRGVRIVPDEAWNSEAAKQADALVIPGGAAGVDVLRMDEGVKQVVGERMFMESWVASICAGPLVLHDAGVLKGRRFTSYPSVRNEFSEGTWVDERVVRDGRLITSQGPGTAFDFALALLEVLADAGTAAQVAADMLWNR
ncbi:MAG: DJ-1/PfpI family protein [Verrucomicrobiota bacterium]|nr:DJ-1/PfpI family protein [Verrucomicrobiota bacterium]